MARQPFPRILGINQLADETAMVNEDKMFVRQATNVDIDRSGNVNRRYGFTSVISGTGYHSLYSSQRGWLMLCHKDELGILDPSSGFTSLVSMGNKYYTSYAEENGNLYVMNPGFSCMFKPSDYTVYPLGVALPSVVPQFAASTAAGSLLAGSYGVTYSIVDPDGEESGLGPVVQIDLADQGSIVGTFFTIAAGYKYRIYMTTTDGEELYQAAEFDADTTSFTVMDHEEGRQPGTFGLEPTPYGHIIRAFNSRLLIGSTNFVYFTEAFRPHLHDAAHGWVATAGFTRMVEPVEDGVYIADKRGVKFYKGEDPSSWQVKDVSPDTVIYGTSTTVPGSFFGGELTKFDSVAVWLSRSGYQIGTPTGEVLRVNAEQVSLPSYSFGCSAYAIRDGRKQFVTPVDSNVLADAGVALDSSIN